MLKLARTIHFDVSDQNVFARPAETGEWAISGGFEFSNFSEGELTGKTRQAFANGWLGLGNFGRATFVAVTTIEDNEVAMLTDLLAQHFVKIYGAPDIDAARNVAKTEIDYMLDLCADHDPNMLLAISRELTEAGVREQFSAIQPANAEIDIVAVHGSVD